jgi:hypothetical protein
MTTNTPATQAPNAAPAAPADPDPAQVPAEGSEVEEDQDGPPDDPADDDGTTDAAKRARREAAGLRQRVKAETARADAAEAALVDFALNQAGLDPRLWAAESPDLNSLRDDNGGLSVEAIVAEAGRVRASFGLGNPGVPQPNPQQGNPSAGRAEEPTTLAQAFSQRRR